MHYRWWIRYPHYFTDTTGKVNQNLQKKCFGSQPEYLLLLINYHISSLQCVFILQRKFQGRTSTKVS